MANVNVQEMLSKPADSFEPPKARPTGTYLWRVGDYTMGESSQKKTPLVEYEMFPVQPMDDVDSDRLESSGGLREEKRQRVQFYLTEDALHRHTGFLEKLGITVAGRGTAECIPETKGLLVLGHINETPGTKRPDDPPDDPPPMYNNFTVFTRYDPNAV